jgi:5-formyltetrahydrofolate cyclo-ligase
VDKTELRARRLAARERMPSADRAAASRALRDAVLELPQVEMAGTIAAYYSIGTEPDTHGLVYALWKRGTYVLLPILLPDGDLDWASYEGPDSLRPAPHGLQEPTEPPRGPAAVSRADVVIVPALAVDAAGNRLGRGGGAYDRALARVAPLIPKIALLYDDDLLTSVPTDPHDRPVTHIARPAHGITPASPAPPGLAQRPARC